MQYCEVSKERYQHNWVVDKEEEEAEENVKSEERRKQDLVLEEVQKEIVGTCCGEDHKAGL